MTMLAPSLVNAAARQLLGRHELFAKLLDDAKGTDRVLRGGLLSEHDGERLATISRIVEGTFEVEPINGTGSSKTNHQLEQDRLDSEGFGVEPDVLSLEESNIVGHGVFSSSER